MFSCVCSWICRKDWKLHNTRTGGFFRCNKWEEEKDHDFYDTPPPVANQTADPDADTPNPLNVDYQGYGTAVHSARVARRKNWDMTRFLHHYSRWTAHGDSAKLEEKMADSASTRLTPVVQAGIEYSSDENFDFSGKGKLLAL
jgi:hypothetical protein